MLVVVIAASRTKNVKNKDIPSELKKVSVQGAGNLPPHQAMCIVMPVGGIQ
jgi:hypothetical protein